MKTKEEQAVLKEEAEVAGRKLAGLSEEELKQVTGGKIERDPRDDEKEPRGKPCLK